MKIQCGECEKYYKFVDNNIPNEGLSFPCDSCSNEFTVSPNLVFSSTNGDSRIICDNCGQLVHESSDTCKKCNLILNKSREDLRIDSKYYESLEIDEKGKVTKATSQKKTKSKAWVYATAALVIIGITVSTVYYLSQNSDIIPVLSEKEPAPVELKVVILNSGDTYYAEEIIEDGLFLKLRHSNGLISEIRESDVLSIADAVIKKE